MKVTILGFIILALFSPIALADTQLYAGSWSYHADRAANYNEVHDQFGIETNGVYLLSYHNSNRDRAFLLGKYYNFLAADSTFNFGLTYGLVSGYGDAPAPFVVPRASFESRGFGVDVHYIPGIVAQVQTRFKVDPENYSPFGTTKSSANYAVGYSNGTLGAGLYASRLISKGLEFRASVDRGDYSRRDDWVGKFENVERLRTRSASLAYVYYPYNWHIGLVAGVIYNKTQYSTQYNWGRWQGLQDGDAVPIYHNGELVATLPYTGFNSVQATAQWHSLSPMLGLRIGNPWISKSRFTMFAEIGVFRLDNLRVSASYDVPYIDDNGLSDQADAELATWVAQEVSKNSKYRLYPAVSAGMMVAF